MRAPSLTTGRRFTIRKFICWSLIKANRIISSFEAGGLAGGGLLAATCLTYVQKQPLDDQRLIFALALCICIVPKPLVQDTLHNSPLSLFTIMGFALYGPHMLLPSAARM
ncbi:hypothetical protein KCP77_10605 [Salmonella enterica subsp. enterica]|nr:hypothetical protein KCP77_10605 [Salmonella enterica subsp. enterica]